MYRTPGDPSQPLAIVLKERSHVCQFNDSHLEEET